MRGSVILAIAFVLAACRPAPGAGADKSGESATTAHGLALRTTAANGTAAARIRVDLYAPAAANKTKAPLVVWLEGNDPVPASEAASFSGDVGDTLQRRGMTTLALSFRVARDYTLRACAVDVAAAIAEVEHAGSYSRLVLAGRGSGASVAALLGLDRSVLAQAGLDLQRVDGVVGVRGTYDMAPAALDGPERDFFLSVVDDARATSPVSFVRADGPPFLLLAGSDDEGTFPRLARTFALALEKAGGRVDSYLVPRHDQHNLTQWGGDPPGPRNELGELVVSFIQKGLEPLPVDTTFGVRQRWSHKPPLDNDEFRTDRSRIATYPVDAEFIRAVSIPLGKARFELNTLPGKTYEAIDLLTYLDGRPESEVGKGDYLVVTNVRDERLFFSRKDLEATKPVIVVGMDDETNLYRVFTHYRIRQAYSWKKGEEPMPMMIRPVGAFLHFRVAPPANLRNKSFMPFGITSKSFAWVANDPLAPVRALPDPIRETLIGEQGCIKCHSFRGAGSKSHHILALDGKPYGAFALPLEEYPTEVLRRFLFEQDAVARSFDVSPLHVDEPIARALFELVTHDKR